jgi:hypothetical protein
METAGNTVSEIDPGNLLMETAGNTVSEIDPLTEALNAIGSPEQS